MEKIFADFFQTFGSHKNMVLSTCENNKVHSRMMSVVCFDGKFYFQTDKSFHKCRDLAVNPYVSLCADQISVEGMCRCAGKPSDSKAFCDIFKSAYPKAYALYTKLDSEVLYEVNPSCIKLWIYEKNEPYIKIYDFQSQKTKTEKYLFGK